MNTLLSYLTVRNTVIASAILAVVLVAGGGYIYYSRSENTNNIVLPDNIPLKTGVMCALVVNAPVQSTVLWLNFNDNLQTLQFDKGKTIVFLTNEKSKRYTVFAVVTYKGTIVQKKIDLTVGDIVPPDPIPPTPPNDPLSKAIEEGVKKDGKTKLADFAETYKKFANKVVDDKTILTVGQLIFVLHSTMDGLIGKENLVETRKNLQKEFDKIFPTDAELALDDALRAKYKETFLKISEYAEQLNKK